MTSTTSGGAIRLRSVQVHFGEGDAAVLALNGIDLDVRAGEFVGVLGPSGCGKSTIIGAVAGFTKVSAGELLVDGEKVNAPGPERGVVFQQHTLFPWKTVLENVEFGLKVRGIGQRERRDSAREMIEHVGLGEFVRHYPHQLSGGMQQRVNLARALVNRPRVLSMDEPFCSLDAQTRLQMHELVLGLWEELHMTVVFVTHEVDEAIYLSDRVAVFSRRPARVKTWFDVPLSRPRSHALLTTPDFANLKRAALDDLLAEAKTPSETRLRRSACAARAAKVLSRPSEVGCSIARMSRKPDTSLSKAAAALEAELAHFEDLLLDLKSPVNSEKALQRARHRLEECSACEEKLAENLRAFAEAMQVMQARQQECMQLLGERAEGVQARFADRNTLVSRINQLGQQARAVAEPITSIDESAWSSPTPELLSSVAEMSSRLEAVIEEAAAVAASAKEADWADVARDADALRQQLTAMRGKLILGQRKLASRAPS